MCARDRLKLRRRLRVHARDRRGLRRLEGRDALRLRRRAQLLVHERLDLCVRQSAARLERLEVVDRLLRRHLADERHEHRRRQRLDRADRDRVRHAMLDDEPRLLRGRLGLRQTLQRVGEAVRGRRVLEQDRVRTRARLDVQTRV